MVCAVGSDRSDPTRGHAGHEARAQGESGLRWGQAGGGGPRAAPLTSAPSASYARVLTMAVGRRCATVGGLFGTAPGRPLCLVNLLVQEVAVPEERGKERRSAMHSSALGSAIRWAIICNP